MEIGPLQNHNHWLLPSSAKPTPELNAKAPEKSQHYDSVELSLDGRQRLAQLADTARIRHGLGKMPPRDTAESDGSLRMDKIQQVRLRINKGFYDQPHIRKEIAEKLADEMTKDIPRDSD